MHVSGQRYRPPHVRSLREQYATNPAVVSIDVLNVCVDLLDNQVTCGKAGARSVQ